MSFTAAASSDGAMGSISTTAECEAAKGSCVVRDNCDLATSVYTGSCGDGAHDGCCLSKENVCASKGGSFLSEAECEAKTGYHITGLHLGDAGCCAPSQGDGSGSGNGSGSGGMSFAPLSYGVQMAVMLICLYCAML